MATISELEQTIRACREMISIIRSDIEGMECGKRDMGMIQASFNTLKEEVTAYDVSKEDKWDGNLYSEAESEKKTVIVSVEKAKTNCKQTIDELDRCIQNALNEITKYENRIADCEAEIARIQAEQAAAALKAQEEAAAAVH